MRCIRLCERICVFFLLSLSLLFVTNTDVSVKVASREQRRNTPILFHINVSAHTDLFCHRLRSDWGTSEHMTVVYDQQDLSGMNAIMTIPATIDPGFF